MAKQGIRLTREGIEFTDEVQEFRIKEWDDTINSVKVKKDNEWEGYALMLYDDGLCHRVTEDYLRSIIILADEE